MFELLGWMFWPALKFFGAIYKADTRPEARRFTIGCFLLFWLMLGLLGAVVYYFALS